MAYVQGFLKAVPNDRKDEYRIFSEKTAAFFRRLGAERLVECWGDSVPDGKLTSFPMAVKLEPGETVVFSWAMWPSKAAHDAGMEKAANDPEIAWFAENMPFDGARLFYAGFDVIVDA